MIAIIGAGAIGAALAAHCVRAGKKVVLCATEFDAAAAAAIRSDEPHPGMDIVLPGDIEVIDSDGWSSVLPQAQIITLAVSTPGLVPTVLRLQPSVAADALWAILTKGIDEATLRSAAAVAADAVGDPSRVVALVGPSLAAEIAAGVPTGLVAACASEASARAVADAFAAPGFRIDISTDVAGVEVGAALKNVVAIAAGVCDGLAALEPHGSWLNAKSYVFARGLQEMASLASALGGDPTTVLGLAGAGDLFVTCIGGRNARFGKLVGEGLAPEAALAQMRTTVEGYNNVRAAAALARKHNLRLRVVEAVNALLFEGLSPRETIDRII